MATTLELDRMKMKLATEGKIIEAGFVLKVRITMNDDFNDAQLANLRSAFFAGAGCMFVKVVSTDTDFPIAEGNELIAFQEGVMESLNESEKAGWLTVGDERLKQFPLVEAGFQQAMQSHGPGLWKWVADECRFGFFIGAHHIV